MEHRAEGECVDGDGPSPDELRAGSPEGRPDCEADEEDGEYKVAYFSPNMELVHNNGDRRGRCGRGEGTIRDQNPSVNGGMHGGCGVRTRLGS